MIFKRLLEPAQKANISTLIYKNESLKRQGKQQIKGRILADEA